MRSSCFHRIALCLSLVGALLVGLTSQAQAFQPKPASMTGQPFRPGGSPDYAKSSWAIGAGLMWFQGFDGAEGDQAIPVISLELRTATPMSTQLAFERVVILTFHDVETVRDIYSWMFAGSSRDHALRLGTGWMILPMIPLAGTNLTYGMGVSYYSSHQAPNFQVSAGITSSILLRVSNEDFVVDVGFGPYVSFATEFHKGFGLNARVHYSVPFYRRFVRDQSINVITATGNMVFPF
jgi:hypothetical protein